MQATTSPSTAEPDAVEVARARLQRAAGADFDVGELIGSGGYADVFRATDLRLGRTVALKVLRADLHTTPDAIERFRREARSIASLSHPHILPIHAIGGDEEVVFLVLAYVDGETLDSRLEREGALPIDEAVRLLCETANALVAAHRAGIAHRDIKPANILLEARPGRALLTDFGIARAVDGADVALTRTGTFIGTPHYLSPEQAAGDTADHRADLYALGVLGYRLITGVLPFDGPAAAVLLQHLTRAPRPVRELRSECPEWLAEAIHRCLAKSPDDRWPSAEALLEALERGGPGHGAGEQAVSRGPSVGQGPTSSPATEATAAFRRTTRTAAGVAVVVLAADLLVTGSSTVSLLLVLGCMAWISLAAGRLWVGGHDPLAALRGRALVQHDQATEEFGRHATLVRRARITRARMLRQLADMSNVERERLDAAVPAADHIVARIGQLARRMVSVDERVSAERARHGPRDAARPPTRLVSELIATRARLEEELADGERVLTELADLLTRASALDAATAGRELHDVLSRAERLDARPGLTLSGSGAEPPSAAPRPSAPRP